MGAPSFKDLVAADISAVFLNGQEFADTHTIDGKPMTVVVDENELLERDKSKMGIDVYKRQPPPRSGICFLTKWTNFREPPKKRRIRFPWP